MKKLTYLIVTMLMALTMVGCQFDPTYLEDKISGLEESDKEQNDRLDSIESRLAVLEDKVVDADTMLEDLKVWAKDNLKGADGKDGKDGKDGENGKDGLNLTVAQIEQIQADLKTWFEENKLLFKGDKGDKGEDGTSGTSADSTKIEKLEMDIKYLLERIVEVENNYVTTKIIEAILNTLKNKANADTLKALSDKFDELKKVVDGIDLSDYLKIADHTEADTYSKTEIDSEFSKVNESLEELESRVDSLETILGVKDATSETINKVKLAIASIDTNASIIATLQSELGTLKGIVTNETDGLVKQIGNVTSNISAIENRVATLEDAKDDYIDFCNDAINGLAETYATKDELNENYTLKSELVGLVENYIVQEIGKATSDLKTVFNNVYATKDELASKLDASKITDIIDEIDNLKDSLVEEVIHYYIDGEFVCASAYLKFNGKYYGYEDIEVPCEYYGYYSVLKDNISYTLDVANTNSPYTFAELQELAQNRRMYNGKFCIIVTEPKTEYEE